MADYNFTSTSTSDWTDGSGNPDPTGVVGQLTIQLATGSGNNAATFLLLQATPTESGIGSVALSGVSQSGGQYQFVLELNEPNSSAGPEITLTGLQVYVTNSPVASLSDLTGLTPAYDLGNYAPVMLEDVRNGDVPDYSLTLPTSALTGGSYVTFVAGFSDSSGGPERFEILAATPTPVISVTKDTVENGVIVDGGNVLAGHAISWDYTVTNIGNVAINGLTLTDNDGLVGAPFAPNPVLSGGFNVGDANHNGLLDPNETWQFTYSGTAIDGGYSNTVQVSATTASAGPATGSASSSYTGVEPSISIAKDTLEYNTTSDTWVSVAGKTVLDGASVEWVYDVTTSGDVALPAPTVADNMQGTAAAVLSGGFNVGDTNQNGLLDPGETWQYAITGTAGDGAYSNTGTASVTYTDAGGATDPLSDTASSSYTGVDPSISIAKHTLEYNTTTHAWVNVDGLTVLDGASIEWTYAVTTTGDAALPDPGVIDTQQGAASEVVGGDGFNVGDTNKDGKLEAGETWQYVITGTAGDGAYSNTGNVSSTYTDGGGNTDTVTNHSDSSYTGVDPSISIAKHTLEYNTTTHAWVNVDGLTVLDGASIEWTYAVTTTGDAALPDPGVIDTVQGAAAEVVGGDGFNVGDTNKDGKLEAGETWQYAITGTAGDGAYSNTGNVSSTYTDGGGNTDTVTNHSDSSYTGVAPAISTNKVTTGDGQTGDGIVIKEGDAVTWTYTVTNTGDVGILGSTITVTDNNGTAATADDFNPAAVMGGIAGTLADASHNYGDVNNNGVLDVGETWKYSASGTAVLGGYSNIGTATASFTDGGGNTTTLTVTDGSSYTGSFVEGVAGLSQGYWYNHTTQTKQDPNHHWASEVNVNGVWGVLLGDSTGALAGHTLTSAQITGLYASGELFIPDAAAIQLINSSQSANDTRQTLMSQAMAAQLNINHGDTDPGVGTSGDLIKEAVAWLEGASPFSGFSDHSSGNVDKLHDGILGADDYNTSKAAFTFEGGDTAVWQIANKALTSSMQAWQTLETFITPGTFISPSGVQAGGSDGLVKADGEGLKNALMAFNQNQLVTDNFGHVAWDASGSTSGPFTYEINNGPNDFWAVLAATSGLHGIV
jgi:hypothetical protein